MVNLWQYYKLINGALTKYLLLRSCTSSTTVFVPSVAPPFTAYCVHALLSAMGQTHDQKV